MQFNTAVGEQGLKVWAKGRSQMALKHGRDKFTFSTSSRVGERMLLDTITDHLHSQEAQQEENETNETMPTTHVSKRPVPHFRYVRTESSTNRLISLERMGKEQLPNKKMGVIQPQIFEGLHDVDINSNQAFFDIWCEARLKNGQYIRCWPQYRGNQGTQYDWVMIKFESEEGDSAAEADIVYPAKVLALYENSKGEAQNHHKCMVH